VTYNWEEIVTQSAEKAIRNAETFVMYAMFSPAADKWFRMRIDRADDAARLRMINRAETFYDQNLERVGGEQDTPFSWWVAYASLTPKDRYRKGVYIPAVPMNRFLNADVDDLA